MSEKYLFYERRWLNQKHGRAFSINSVRAYTGCGEVYANIGDCNEDIHLDFSFEIRKNVDDFDKQTKKLDDVIASLVKLRKAMNTARAEVIKLNKAKPKNNLDNQYD